MEREARLQGVLHPSKKSHLLGSPVKKPFLKVPLMETLADRYSTTRTLGIMTTAVHDMLDPTWFSRGAETYYFVSGVDIRSFS
jgi:hypothetical protein